MASYRRRLERDLDDWIGRGLVSADSRAAILDSVGEARRLDASTALAIIGGLLAGVAMIAFVAANWSDIPRIARFALVLTAFLASAGGAAWASGAGRTVTGHVLLSVAALVFAAAIGLTGQIFDIAGDPQAALRAAGLAAGLLALAGRSPWAAAVGLAMIAFGDFTGRSSFGGVPEAWPGWLVVAAPMGVVTALFWRSQALAHVAGIAAILAVLTFDDSLRSRPETVFLSAAAVLAAGAAGARFLRDRFEGPAVVLYGWFVWGALGCFGLSGFDDNLRGVGHSIAWLALAAGAVALGRHDRHAPVTAAGVIGLFAAGATLLFNLGVGLMTSAAVFGGAALVALAVAWAMRGRKNAA
ncbi:MAG: DUF2157 domain-containing protein [Alphaproteobacteria bacterium]|nr:DUF2157 domain-containing protein [Alphaproteobacteria bacterium]MBU1513155.1 DUF2157 domain-containing protein [Alphaproteobacteria bacterium]MBU2095263.1 DUF2157 domain-containing protein [Alphaproteobacteria bacterium]MBU2152178.1 DUF2157 domain-containing protein [Alphaproteobacteria bacterium]MBU2306775.1 DUF2157 domain-containing protein [Alphaproteobacteria bacterium]